MTTAATENRTPILVTGVPRSGTTWLARLLAQAPGTALAGREPMNPRGRQYALAGTLDAWTQLELPTPRQRRALKATYLGLNPRTYGRYGLGQWKAPLPGTRIVVKDPFAMLSVPCITNITGATGVQLYRHPGAVLASYRRMNWRADIEEMASFAEAAAASGDLVSELFARDPATLSDTDAMGVFWSILSTIALDGMARNPTTIMVAHYEVAAGGEAAVARLFSALGLTVTAEVLAEINRTGSKGATSTGSPPTDSGAGDLHRFDRNPTEVAQAWKQNIPAEDVARIEEVTEPVRARVEEARHQLLTAN